MASSTTIAHSDDQNLLFAASGAAAVDAINAEFYGQFPYPWRPFKLDRAEDPDFERIMLCQSLGDWPHEVIPRRPSIWVAGCGTNQAAITALRFPDGSVVGSDLSAASLALCADTAAQVGAVNLDLRNESINGVAYAEAFDYVIATGVIHHNADPAMPLRRLAAALKPNGILELMVYNRFHRIWAAAVQKAIRTMAASRRKPNPPLEIELTTSLVGDLDVACMMRKYLSGYQDAPPERIADAFIQPLEYSYTVATLNELAASCGLELVLPCVNPFDAAEQRIQWNIEFKTPALRACYAQLSDPERWQVTNLLLCERSPMLWFYLRRADATVPRRSEAEVSAEFLDCTFTRTCTSRRAYMLDGTGYRLDPRAASFPAPHADEALRAVVQEADGATTMRTLFERHGIATSFPAVNLARLRLTTCAFPYLRAV